MAAEITLEFLGEQMLHLREEMLHDISILGAGLIVGADGWEQKLEQNKQAYFAQLASSARFTTLYPQTLTPEQFVDALNANAGGALSQGERDALVNDLKNSTKTRAQVLREVVESQEVRQKMYHDAFVLMEYYGYLRRDPETAGFQAWLNYLNAHPGDFRTMVKGFVNSVEYRMRFGPPGAFQPGQNR